jgi:DNA-binding Xre family transcriptional regulator
MSAAKIIKQILTERDMSVKQLAKALDMTPQNMSNKLFRDSFSFKDFVKIADILNCDVKVVTRDTKKEFS